MTKLKKKYCIASFLFAVIVLSVVLVGFRGNTKVYAASMDPDSIGSFTQTDGQKATSATSDNNNGLSISYNNDTGSVSTPIRMLLVLTVLALAPSILIMMTSYTRVIIVLHFLRTAIGTQTSPPNQILIGLALFITFFINMLFPISSRFSTTHYSLHNIYVLNKLLTIIAAYKLPYV